MDEKTLKIAKQIERLKREFSMLPSLEFRNAPLEIEEYQHYLLQLEELVIVFKYLQENPQQVPQIPLDETNAKPENKEEFEEPIAEDVETPVIENRLEVVAAIEDEAPIESSEDITSEEPVNETEIEEQEPEEITSSFEEGNQEEEAQEYIAEVFEEETPESLPETENQAEKEKIKEENNVSGLADASTNEETVIPSSFADKAFRAGEDNSLASKFARQPIADLRKAFGLNERFLYANELFGGDGQEFVQALNELNHLANFNDAMRMIEAKYFEAFGWNKEDEYVVSFLEIVERRYL